MFLLTDGTPPLSLDRMHIILACLLLALGGMVLERLIQRIIHWFKWRR